RGPPGWDLPPVRYRRKTPALHDDDRARRPCASLSDRGRGCRNAVQDRGKTPHNEVCDRAAADGIARANSRIAMANSYRSSALLGAMVLASAGPALADRTITLDDALALARANNRDLRGARERVAVAHAGVEQARAALFPTIVAQGKYTHNYKQVDFDAAALAA